MKTAKYIIVLCLGMMLVVGCKGTARNGQQSEVQDVRVMQTQEESTALQESGAEWIMSQLVLNPSLPEPLNNTYTDLNVATYLTKIGDTFFLVDCYHNQILYHDNIKDDVAQWQVLTRDVNYAHTIAGDGVVLLVDDTDNNRLLVFEKTKDGYLHTQTLEEIGIKPHFVQYNEKKGCFYAWSSITGEMYVIRRAEDTDRMYVEKILSIPELYGVYVRSFTMIGEDIYFVSGHNNGTIIQADAETLEIKERYLVAADIAGMVQLVKIQDYYYITVSTNDQENQDYATIVRTRDLHSLENGEYEDIYQQLGVDGGTPYYINHIGERYYLTHHRTQENVIAFDVVNNTLENVAVLY